MCSIFGRGAHVLERDYITSMRSWRLSCVESGGDPGRCAQILERGHDISKRDWRLIRVVIVALQNETFIGCARQSRRSTCARSHLSSQSSYHCMANKCIRQGVDQRPFKCVPPALARNMQLG